jgi:hypothetical protein
VERLDQIDAVAPALEEKERRQLADRLNEAMSKVITAASWTKPQGEIELDVPGRSKLT